ncbi:MAG: DNA polymerase III subunit delta [Patescibacteria group bacterium]|nr:DNA polymerase III subunit delta [Patescibacteria group bacterium]MDD4303873.1 DNA polymerase III subunit delta [Patescibacteria group bacterium]MDD4695140.1 DNA polymerase III subunit delta [Patescibacteria group bacterium]
MLFFLYGDDSYRSSEKLNQIKDKFIREVDSHGYNIVTLDDGITVENFTKEFSQAGFFVSKKLIIIKYLLKQNITKQLSEVVQEYIDKSYNDEGNIIIFYEDNLPHSIKQSLSGEKLKIWKKLTQSEFSIEFKKLPDQKVIEWIRNKFLENGKHIDKNLANKILSLVGNDLWLISSEIEKISNHSKSDSVVEDDITDIICASIDDNIFLLCEKLANKKTKEAIDLLGGQMELGINPYYLLTMIVRQYRILIQVRSAIDEKVSINNLPKYLSLHPFVIKKSIDLVNKYSFEELKNIYNKLLNLDRQMKSSKLKQETLLNLFFISI